MQIELTLEEIRSILAECSNCDLTARLEEIYNENKPQYLLTNSEALIALAKGKTIECEADGDVYRYRLVDDMLQNDFTGEFEFDEQLIIEKDGKWRIVTTR